MRACDRSPDARGKAYIYGKYAALPCAVAGITTDEERVSAHDTGADESGFFHEHNLEKLEQAGGAECATHPAMVSFWFGVRMAAIML